MGESILGEIVQVGLDLLEPYPGNPRIGDVEAIKKSLEANEQFVPLVVQSSTGFILSGNHTYRAAQELGWETIAVVYVDVDDQHAKRILLAANRISDLGGYDESLLASILADIREDALDLLEGTGYTSDEVEELLGAAIFFEMDEADAGESVDFAASMLDRIMPPSVGDEEEAEDEESRNVASVGDEGIPHPDDGSSLIPTEYVIFRFGELRAKVEKGAYDRFVKILLKGYGGDLFAAGVGVVSSLGIDEDSVHPGVVVGTERWL